MKSRFIVYGLWFMVISALVSSGCAKKEKAVPAAAISQDAKAAYEQGVRFYNTQKYGDALSAFKNAADKEPKFAEAWCEYGLTLMEMGKFEDALAPLKKAADLNAGYPKAHFALAVAYVRMKTPNAKLARTHYNKAVKLGYKVPEWFVRYLEKLEKARR